MSGRRRPAAAALLLLLAACRNGDGSSQAVRESAGATPPEETTITAAPPATSTTSRAGVTTTTRRVTTTVGGRATTAPAPTASRALAPLPPGTYRYDTAGSSAVAGVSAPFPSVTTLVVDAPSGTRQRSKRSLRDASGQGSATEYTLDYRSDGVYLVSLRVVTTFGGATDTRDQRPTSPVLLLGTGAGPGAIAEADLAGVSPARLVIDVLRREAVTIGGRALDTLVVRAVVTLRSGDTTGRQELTLNLDRATGLWVKERSVADASAAGGLFTLHSEYTAIVQRLTPS